MAIPGFLGHGRIPLDGLDLLGHFPAIGQPHHLPFPLFQDGQLPILQKNHLVGVGKQGRDIRGHQATAPLGNPQNQGALMSHRHQPVRLAGPQNSDGVGAFHLFQGLAHRLDQIAAWELLLNEMGENLGVGFRAEDMPAPLQLFPKGMVILDDAVVDHNQIAAAVAMRVSIKLGRRPVRGPTGMAQADMAVAVAHRFQQLFELAQLARGPVFLELAAMDIHHPGGIIAPVLQTLQAFKKNGQHMTLPHITDYSAHIPLRFLFSGEQRVVHLERKNVAQSLNCKRSAVPQMRGRGLRSVLLHMSRPMTKQMRCC